MYRFFDTVTRPLLDALEPSVVVEIGSDNGYQTELLAEWCASAGATLHVVDPLPEYDTDEWSKRWPGTIAFHVELSLNALPDIGAADLVCIDGDHNWYTVYHELEILAVEAGRADHSFPVTLLHDVGWPYGRRDLYHDPETIPGWFRHPHRKGGLDPVSREPLLHGFNDHHENAILEGTPRNGVLTAVEDFIAESELDLVFDVLPGIHGLGLLADRGTLDAIGESWREILGPAGLRRLAEAIEGDRIRHVLDNSDLKRRVDMERDRVGRLQSDLEAKAETLERVRDQKQRAEAAAARLRDELEEARERTRELSQEVSATREDVEAARTKARRSVDDARRRADERVREAEQRLQASEEDHRAEIEDRDAQMQAIRKKLDSAERDLHRLRNRRSVRAALMLAKLARPVFKLRRGQFGTQSRTRNEESSRSQTDSEKDATEPGNECESKASYAQTSHAMRRRSGIFYDEVNRVIEGHVPDEFLRAWDESERGLSPASSAVVGNEQPLVSIIMPTYNRADILDQALRSVLDQTYGNWELHVCDDGSEDATGDVVLAFDDPRIVYHQLPWGGAARARNTGLQEARGELIAYLDSDNLWHPHFLEVLVTELVANPGQHMAYCKYIDTIASHGQVRLKKYPALPFDYDRLAAKNFIDLNTVMHRRELYEHFGGFNEELFRQQDWHLLLRYSYLRDPLYVDRFLLLYRRSDDWGQLTRIHRDDDSSLKHIRSMVEDFYRDGLPTSVSNDLPSVSIISWDVCRNHFSKAYNLAEALHEITDVHLLGFRFFDEPIFPPYAEATPGFRTTYLPGTEFPSWSDSLETAVAGADADVVYAVKPRLPSLGVALLHNYHFGTPVVLEINDLESVVTRPTTGQRAREVRLADVDPADPRLLNPYGELWTSIMEGLADQVPLRATHNSVLDDHFGGGSFLVRNLKDERHFNPSRYDRRATRERLGFEEDDRILLFGGMVRGHKGVFELAEALERAGSHYRLLVVGSRETSDQRRLAQEAGDRIRIVGPVDRNEMAAINHASDAIVLWLDPDVAASHYQMPFKLTDAFAMRVPVIANDIGDLGDLGRRGFLRIVPFGDGEGLVTALGHIEEDRAATDEMVDRARRLYLRQFSYAAVRRHMELILDRAAGSAGTLPVAEEFVAFLSRFREESDGTAPPTQGRVAV